MDVQSLSALGGVAPDPVDSTGVLPPDLRYRLKCSPDWRSPRPPSRNRQCFIQTPKLWGEITTAGGVDDRAPKARSRVAVGDETETPKASMGWGMGRGIPLPSRLGGLGERRELPSGVQGGAPAENEFGAL